MAIGDNRFPAEPQPQATWGSDLVPAADRGKPVVTVECSEPKEALSLCRDELGG